MVRQLSPEKREAILNSALKLLVSQGLKNTSTADISKAAGMAAGTLFLYFPTKQALLDELALKIAKEQSDAIQSLLDASLPARDTFATIWHGSIHWFLEHREAYQYAQQTREIGVLSDEAVQKSGAFFSYYYAAIQKGHAESSLKPYPLDLIGSFLYYDLMAAMTSLQAQPDPGNQEEIIQQGFEIFWDGIRAPGKA